MKSGHETDLHEEFKGDLKKIRDKKIQTRLKKIVQKILDNPEIGKTITKPMQSTEQNIHRKERRERKAAPEYKQRTQYELASFIPLTIIVVLQQLL
jgi:mRNA-degrading endonuclease RelE of RelBE toxin-antitoxin system